MTIAVELDPPAHNREGGVLPWLIDGAKRLKDAGADLITMADNPCAESRGDCAILAPLTMREAGVPVMPHLACRDRGERNLRSALVALDAAGIHEALAVTGDPERRQTGPGLEMGANRSSLRMNSTDFARLAGLWAADSFSQPFRMSAALNVNAPNFDAELRRAERKIQAGVSRFLTQPALSERAIRNIERARGTLRAEILGGILPIVSWKNAQFLESRIHGIRVSPEVTELYRDASKEKAEELAVSISMDYARDIAEIAHGWYIITPFKRIDLAARIVSLTAELRSGLTPRTEDCYKVS